MCFVDFAGDCDMNARLVLVPICRPPLSATQHDTYLAELEALNANLPPTLLVYNPVGTVISTEI